MQELNTAEVYLLSFYDGCAERVYLARFTSTKQADTGKPLQLLQIFQRLTNANYFYQNCYH